ncbi:MAG: molybdopterin-guanine dinucleotide biosynthesis protein B [Deltaproteobacteria bacterium]|nr:MAG: molybdopterin-guanine dinucleotide biosynthesis protein B [Deltaproteobacteria bacterium]
MTPVVSIVGRSNAGKTTILEKLISELKLRGYRIGTIKHSVHGFDIDHKGKDSWRHKHAGASTVVISSPKEIALIKDIETETTLDSLIPEYFNDVDIVLAEGYKKENTPKIEVARADLHEKPFYLTDDNIIAIVSDRPCDTNLPCFGPGAVRELADFVERTFLSM